MTPTQLLVKPIGPFKNNNKLIWIEVDILTTRPMGCLNGHAYLFIENDPHWTLRIGHRPVHQTPFTVPLQFPSFLPCIGSPYWSNLWNNSANLPNILQRKWHWQCAVPVYEDNIGQRTHLGTDKPPVLKGNRYCKQIPESEPSPQKRAPWNTERRSKETIPMFILAFLHLTSTNLGSASFINLKENCNWTTWQTTMAV